MFTSLVFVIDFFLITLSNEWLWPHSKVIYFLWILLDWIQSCSARYRRLLNWIVTTSIDCRQQTSSRITHHLLPIRLVHLFISLSLWFAALLALVVFVFLFQSPTNKKLVVFTFVFETLSYLIRKTFSIHNSKDVSSAAVFLNEANVGRKTQSNSEFFRDFTHCYRLSFSNMEEAYACANISWSDCGHFMSTQIINGFWEPNVESFCSYCSYCI